MIFSAYRACCCLETCGENTCCWICPDVGCGIQIPVCGCYDVPCSSVPLESRYCPCSNFSSEPGGVVSSCDRDCELSAYSLRNCSDPCDERPGSTVLYAPIKCVECRYFDSNSPGIIDSRDITAGTPLLGETICRRAVPGVTAGTDFGSPNIGDDGTNWWLGGTGGIFENIPCEKIITIGGTDHYLESINYCGCTGCTTPELFLGPTSSYWEGNGTLVVVDVCGLSGW